METINDYVERVANEEKDQTYAHTDIFVVFVGENDHFPFQFTKHDIPMQIADSIIDTLAVRETENWDDNGFVERNTIHTIHTKRGLW